MATRGVRSNAEVDCWFAELDPSIEPADATRTGCSRRGQFRDRLGPREIILAADPRITDLVQYGTVQFVCASPMANFVLARWRNAPTNCGASPWRGAFTKIGPSDVYA